MIDWQRIIGLRDIVIHRYDAVNQDILWTIINSELAPLLTPLEPLLTPLPDQYAISIKPTHFDGH